MAIEQKMRSLYCGLPAGLNFVLLDDRNILPLKHVPYELQLIVAKWVHALPEANQNCAPETALINDHPDYGLSLTEIGWSSFVSWMLQTLEREQGQTIVKPVTPIK